MSPLLPSGRQVALAAHGQSAVVVEVGGGLRDYRVDGRAVLDGFAEDEMCTAGRGLPLVPWPNRLRDGSYTWDGVRRELPLDERAKGNATHGLARWLSWTPVDVADDRVTMTVTLWPRPAWPFTLTVSVEYVLGPDGLAVTTVAQNAGVDDLPYACGHHPYLTVGTATVDEAELHLPAATWLPTDDDQIPTGRAAVAGTGLDFGAPRRIGGTRIDHAFTDLALGPDGRIRVVLRNPGDGRVAELWADRAYPYLEVFTGDAVPQPERRRRGLAVEPMTAPPNALQTGEDVVRLVPAGAHTGRWGIAPRGW
ncbi:MAG TPA: aldose 1-epimerase family protein [Mycobacteriales bacterium]|jgi:aldose 1-epimerase|nr:aldose 1-epimerase family protein [Mycobacteriales bacterium]